MQTVFDILRRKGSRVVTTGPEVSVFEAIERMVENNVGSIVVVEGTDIVGIFTERDYLRRIVLEGRTSRETALREIMTKDVVYIEPTETIKQCLAVMTEKKIRHLPVMDESELAGVVSIGDCVKELSRGAEVNVRYLTDYITGRYPA